MNEMGTLAGFLTKKSRLTEDQKKELWRLIDEYAQLCVNESWDGSRMPGEYTDPGEIEEAKKKLEEFLESALTC